MAFMMTLSPFQIMYDLSAYQAENGFDEVFSGVANGAVAALRIVGACVHMFSYQVESLAPSVVESWFLRDRMIRTLEFYGHHTLKCIAQWGSRHTLDDISREGSRHRFEVELLDLP